MCREQERKYDIAYAIKIISLTKFKDMEEAPIASTRRPEALRARSSASPPSRRRRFGTDESWASEPHWVERKKAREAANSIFMVYDCVYYE